MADNWQLEDKINEVVTNYNKLLPAILELLESIDENQRMGVQRAIDTIPIRILLKDIRLIDLLDLSPRNIEAHQPRLIVREPRNRNKEIE